MGGSGDYFDVADTVICMEDYHARDVTADAKEVSRQFGPVPLLQVPQALYGSLVPRRIQAVHAGEVVCA